MFGILCNVITVHLLSPRLLDRWAAVPDNIAMSCHSGKDQLQLIGRCGAPAWSQEEPDTDMYIVMPDCCQNGDRRDLEEKDKSVFQCHGAECACVFSSRPTIGLYYVGLC